MTGRKTFFDTVMFIYALEAGDVRARTLFDEAIHAGPVGTSAVTVMEYCTGCLKHEDPDAAEHFLRFIKDLDFELTEIDEKVALDAARIRAEYPGLHAMDALQLAGARSAGADVFYTNDKRLMKFRDEHMAVREM